MKIGIYNKDNFLNESIPEVDPGKKPCHISDGALMEIVYFPRSLY